jgi:ketosteroid isomerase-like protein
MVSPVTGTAVAGSEADPAVLQAWLACTDVITAFFRLVDAGQASRTLELFTDDAVMRMGDVEISGDALRSAMRGRETDGIRRVHFPTPASFRLTADGRAEAQTLLQLFILGDEQAAGPKARALTRLNDRFVRGEDRVWRLAERAVTVLAGGE